MGTVSSCAGCRPACLPLRRLPARRGGCNDRPEFTIGITAPPFNPLDRFSASTSGRLAIPGL
jgi:hypothetical protein